MKITVIIVFPRNVSGAFAESCPPKLPAPSNPWTQHIRNNLRPTPCTLNPKMGFCLLTLWVQTGVQKEEEPKSKTLIQYSINPHS